MSSGVRDSLTVTSVDAAGACSGPSPKIALNSVKNIENTGAGIFRVGEKTIPTLRTLILLISELLTMPMRNAESARIKVQLAFGSRCTSML